jgi:hypothetical protein
LIFCSNGLIQAKNILSYLWIKRHFLFKEGNFLGCLRVRFLTEQKEQSKFMKKEKIVS